MRWAERVNFMECLYRNKAASILKKKIHDLPTLFVPIPVILPDFELIQLFPPDSKH